MTHAARLEPEPCLSSMFTLFDVPEPRAPLVIASPHSGRLYPERFLAQARIDLMQLRRSEDAYVDLLVDHAPQLGLPFLRAEFPRSFCDVNRDALELDPAMFRGRLPEGSLTGTAKVRSGLGMIARVAGAGRGIYRHQLPVSEIHERISGYWLPYHRALSAMMGRCRERFGACLLLDVHSMPSLPHHSMPQIVLGDLHGKSCDPSLVAGLRTALERQGFSVGMNDPYAGGYITARYGRPREQRHVIQMEISRSLYLDEFRCVPLPRLSQERLRLRAVLDDLSRLSCAVLAGKGARQPINSA